MLLLGPGGWFAAPLATEAVDNVCIFYTQTVHNVCIVRQVVLGCGPITHRNDNTIRVSVMDDDLNGGQSDLVIWCMEEFCYLAEMGSDGLVPSVRIMMRTWVCH